MKVDLPLMQNVLTPLVWNIVIPSEITAVGLAVAVGIHKKF